MIRFVREIRLLPVVLIAIAALFMLKIAGIVFEGGYTLSPRATTKDGTVAMIAPSVELPATAAPGAKSWAQEIFNYPEVTGAVVGPKAPDADAAKDAKDKPAEPGQGGGTVIPLDPPRAASAAERALLERLHARRQELDARARELDLRESLLKAAEKRLEARTNELKELEARAGGALQRKEEADAARFKGLVAVYENMRPKDAARIFDRLDLKILVDVTNQISPRRMSDILAHMSPEAAERLTVELANRASGERPPPPSDLPKIEGRPNGS
jgi:flagellar motility protein MotE (MotC chaperone)